MKEPINEKIHLYDTDKLEEIVQNEDMYNEDLVKKCKEELEIRKLNTQLESKVSSFDDVRIKEILDSPSIYSQELVRSCEIEKTRRMEEILKKEKQEEEERRLMYEQREMERKEDMLGWLQKSGLIILGVIIVFGGIVYFSDSYVTKLKRAKAEEKEKMEQLEAQRIEAERLEKERMEEEKKKAEAKAKRDAEAKRREEARVKAENEKLKAEKEKQRLIEGPFEVGEYHAPTNGVIICLDDTKKHGVVMTLNYQDGMHKDWQHTLAHEGWRFPTKEEVEEIWRNMEIINKTIKDKSGGYNTYGKRSRYSGNVVAFYTDEGVAYDYNGESTGRYDGYSLYDGYTRLVKSF